MTTYLGKELFILFAASAFRKLSSIYVLSYFPFGFEGRIWDLIESVPDHCLSFYFLKSLWSYMPDFSDPYCEIRANLPWDCEIYHEILKATRGGGFQGDLLL